MTVTGKFSFSTECKSFREKSYESEAHSVATDLENLEKSGNLKETSESQGICLKSQGICDRIPKVREKSGNFVV